MKHGLFTLNAFPRVLPGVSTRASARQQQQLPGDRHVSLSPRAGVETRPVVTHRERRPAAAATRRSARGSLDAADAWLLKLGEYKCTRPGGKTNKTTTTKVASKLRKNSVHYQFGHDSVCPWRACRLRAHQTTWQTGVPGSVGDPGEERNTKGGRTVLMDRDGLLNPTVDSKILLLKSACSVNKLSKLLIICKKGMSCKSYLFNK